MTQIIKYHVAVEHLRITFQTFFGKAIIVIPRFYFPNQCIYVCICRQLSGVFIVLKHGPHICLTESQHHIELEIGADVPADIESAGEIIQCNGADTCHEDAFEHSFKLFENLPVESAGMSQGMIDFITLFVQNYVGEVVIFVNNQIEMGTIVAGLSIQKIQLVGGAFQLLHF